MRDEKTPAGGLKMDGPGAPVHQDGEPICAECYKNVKWMADLDERLCRKFGMQPVPRDLAYNYGLEYQRVHLEENGVHPYSAKPKAKRKAGRVLSFAPRAKGRQKESQGS